MKQAYDIGLHGNYTQVKDGSWKEVFGSERSGEDVKYEEDGPEPKEAHDQESREQ
jgi:hypothetical protein